MRLFKALLNTVPRPYLIKMSYWASPLLAKFYAGETFTDPIDGRSYRKFLPYGYQTQRENVLAPGTLSLERHRLMWLYLKRETDFFSRPMKVLHMAPEQCFLKRFGAMKNLDYTTADLYSPIVDVKADILDLPFPKEHFDFVICNHVLEHIEDDRKAMSELFRVLKKGGRGIFQIPQDVKLEKTYEDFSIQDPKQRAEKFGQYDHVRVYGMDYFDRLRSVGFEVEELRYAKQLKPEEVKRFCLSPEEILPFCTKN